MRKTYFEGGNEMLEEIWACVTIIELFSIFGPNTDYLKENTEQLELFPVCLTYIMCEYD